MGRNTTTGGDWLSLKYYVPATEIYLNVGNESAGNSKIYNFENLIDSNNTLSQTAWGTTGK